MLGKKLRESFKEKLGKDYTFNIDNDKDYQINEDKLKVTYKGKISEEFKIRTIKYVKSKEWFDNYFESCLRIIELGENENKANAEKFLKNKERTKRLESPMVEDPNEYLEPYTFFLNSSTKMKDKVRYLKNKSKEEKYLFFYNVTIAKYGLYSPYDVSNFKPNSINTKQNIICEKHGSFKSSVKNFLMNNLDGCPGCKKDGEVATTENIFNNLKDIDPDLFLELTKDYTEDEKSHIYDLALNKANNTNYDFSKFRPINEKDVQPIICEKHGEFKTSIHEMLFDKKLACPKCEEEKLSIDKDWEKIVENNKKKREEETEKLLKGIKKTPKAKKNMKKESIEREISNNFNIDKVKDNIKESNENKKEIIPESIPKIKDKRKYSVQELKEYKRIKSLNTKIKNLNNFDYTEKEKTEVYQTLANIKHGKDKYNMSKFRPSDKYERSIVICKDHGEFKINANDLIEKGINCPSCSNGKSSIAESKVSDEMKYLGFEIERQNRDLLDGKEIDILCKEHKLAIEVNGVKYHSNETKSEINAKYHQLKKYNELKEKGYHLLNLFDDDIRNETKRIDGKNYAKFLHQLLLFKDDYSVLDYGGVKIKSMGFFTFKDFFENHSTEDFYGKDSDFFALYYKGYIICAFSFNNKTNVSHNFISLLNTDADLIKIKKTFPSLTFNVKSDSYTCYKFEKFGMYKVGNELPIEKTFLKGTSNDSYIRNKIDRNKTYINKVYDTGSTNFIFE
ncbi:hypothetical protein [Staphylococcus phage vB_StaM_PB50]|nr:hypothetical protein [Staphylococcus phage vB_StaM_PB50]